MYSAAATSVALLRFFPGAPGESQRTISIVDFTVAGNTPGILEIHNQGFVLDARPLPQLMLAPGNESLIFVFSATINNNEVQRLNIHRSDTGDVCDERAAAGSNLNGNVAASITAAESIINHPQQIGNDQTTAPRPAGECNIVDDNPQFGEVVLGGRTRRWRL